MAKKNNKDIVQRDKSWDKKEYLFQRLLTRPRGFYIDTGNLFLQISFILASLTLLMSLYTAFKIHNLPNHASYYINSVDGKIYENKLTQEKFEKMKIAMAAIRAEQAQKQSQNKE